MKNYLNIVFNLLIFAGCVFPITSYAVTKQLWVGETFKCDATSAVMGLTSDVSWSTNGGYLSLNGSGFYRDVTATQYFAGTATITCSWKYRLYSGGNWTTQSRSWTVSCLENPVSISPTKLELAVGSSGYIRYSHQYNNNYASAANVTFSSTNNHIATVSNSGKVTAVSPGTCYVTIYSKISSASTAPSCKVTVKEIPVTGVSIPSNVTFLADKKIELSTTITPNNATVNSKKWFSTDERIVTINNQGVLTGISPGQANVYCTVNGIPSNNCNVIVTEPEFIQTSNWTENNECPFSVFVEPTVSFSLHLYEGDNFSSICLEKGSQRVAGNVILKGNTLIFKPEDLLEPNTNYSFKIPAYSLKNKWGTHHDGDYSYVFDTGELEQIVLSFSHSSGIIQSGTNIEITSNVPNAEIYYTINEDTPTFNSIRYKSPISVNNDITIKAIAKLKGYKDSEITTVSYQVAKLAYTVSPDINEENAGKNTLPCVRFNQPISPAEKFNDIELLCNGNKVAGTVVIQDTVLFYVPDALLEIGKSYTFNVPENAIATKRDESNKEISTAFSTGRYAINVAASGRFAAAIMSDGSLWTWGYNQYGYLGDGTYTTRHSPVKILDNVKQVDLGSGHGVALKNDGSVWTWGANYSGQLGNGTSSTCINPIKVMDNVYKVSAGDERTMFIKKDYSLWICGDNFYGQIGDGTKTTRKTPVKILSNVISASTGHYQSAAVTKDGNVYTWGCNVDGALGGWPSSGNSTTGTNKPYKSYTNGNAAIVDCGEGHTAILTNSGVLRCTGNNGSGQGATHLNSFSGYPGLMAGSGGWWNEWAGNPNVHWNQIATGGKNTSALDKYGRLYVCGENQNGMVGIIGSNYLLDVDYLYYEKLTDVKTFDIGNQLGIAIKNDGSVWTWGKNDKGQLGIGYTSTKEIKPLKVLDGFTTTPMQKLELPSFIEVKIGQTFVLPTTIEPFNAEYNNLVWSCDNNDIAEISGNGIVSAKSTGTTTIHVDAYYGSHIMSASCKISVEKATSIGKINVNPIEVSSSNGFLHIDGLTIGENIAIYDTTGALIKSECSNGGRISVCVPQNGIYIIKIGNRSLKVIL